MYKQITGKEALKRIADGEEVFYRSVPTGNWNMVNLNSTWVLKEFTSPKAEYTFAIKTEPMRIEFDIYIGLQSIPALPVDVSKFLSKRVRVTVEEIEP